MPFCAVRTCGESGQFACKKSEGQIISFHRFPSDPRIKAKWIRATDQRKTKPSWRPTNASTICSKHFKREDFFTCTDLKFSAVPISGGEQDLLDGFMKDSVDNSDTDSVDDIIELPQPNQSITSEEFTEKDEEIPIDYEPAPTTSLQDQPESNQPITVQDSEPEFSETSSELEFIELDSSEAKNGQLSVEAIENPQRSDEQPAYGMKISKAYSTRKRSIVQMKDQIKTNIKMYRIDPVTNTVRPVTIIPKDSFNIDPAKPPVIIRQNKDRDRSGKPIYLIKKSAESLDGNSQKTKANQSCSSQLQYANSTTKNIATETGSNSNRLITLSMYSEEPKKVYSTPVPNLAQINQELPAKKADIVKKNWKATKLNPTMETDGRVKKHRKVTSKSIIKKITPSANMSTAPDGCCGPQLKLTLWNVSKPKPTVSRLAPAVLRPTTSVATPADSMPTSTVSTPSPADLMRIPADSTPSPTDLMRITAVSTLTLADSILTLADSTPTPADSMPIPPDSTPIPADSTPTPADSMRIPADSTPSPTYSIATPAVLTPTLADSTPTPADSTPTPTDSTPTPADSTRIPVDSTPTPADSMPIPAVLSPAVQKLDDSNIHTLDEYDTFAKHVATQLRQLSLQSYLSAQGEIQSILSRYRLSDLNRIKKNPNL